jgi:hypothetical protein
MNKVENSLFSLAGTNKLGRYPEDGSTCAMGSLIGLDAQAVRHRVAETATM